MILGFTADGALRNQNLGLWICRNQTTGLDDFQKPENRPGKIANQNQPVKKQNQPDENQNNSEKTQNNSENGTQKPTRSRKWVWNKFQETRTWD